MMRASRAPTVNGASAGLPTARPREAQDGSGEYLGDQQPRSVARKRELAPGDSEPAVGGRTLDNARPAQSP